MAEVADSAPPLRLNAQDIVYTDGSKVGTSITAAWVHPATAASEALSIPGLPSAQWTPVRGEVVAIDVALHSPRIPLCHPLDLMTDSLTSLQMTSA